MTESADQTQAMAGADITDQLQGPKVLGGRYELTERIASGGMASVWRAYDDVLARTVAVKVLHDHLAADEDFRERFRREAIAAAKLTHPYVVSLYDTGSDGNRVYLVMEFVDGATLREVVSDLGQLEPGQAASIGEKVARALDYAHERGLVHRDVKPANILIGDDGSVKVADFGIAKADENDGDLTKTGMVLGTAAYVAPEQITGSIPVDGRADQYALGCMLYEALAGRQPFKGETAVATAAQRLESSPPPLRSLRPDIPRGLESIVMRAMAREPDDRFVSLGAMADALAAFADADPSHTAALPMATSHRATGRRAVAAPPTVPSMPTPPPRPPREESFLRTEGRWLLPVLFLVLVAGGLIAVGIATGMFAGLPAIGRDPETPQPQATQSAPVALEIDGVVSYDPAGDANENDEQLAALLDDDPTTTWRTETYNSEDFGGLKEGVGVYVDLGRPQTVTALELDIISAGLNAQIAVANDVAEDISGWTQVAELADGEGEQTVELPEPAQARYVLVWITAPLPESDRYKAELAGISVVGPSEGDS